ncbi:MAG: nuclear transport factor 2 family protein [Bacteroidia bacterium]|nr:nuclear transport factor 2 family protein [Bacteroidia bacterium]
MNKHLFLSALLLGIIFSACKTPSPAPTALQKATIEKQILEQWDKVNSTIEKSDAAGFLAFFSSDEFLAMFSHGTPFLTRNAYADSVNVWFSARKNNEITQKTIKVNVLAEDLAVLDQVSVFQVNFKDDRIIRINHSVSFIFKKEAAGWKIIHGHESW